MTNRVLDKLVKSGTIKSYSYDVIDQEGEDGVSSYNKNTEKLILVFPDNKTLTIETICSSYEQGSGMIFDTSKPKN